MRGMLVLIAALSITMTGCLESKTLITVNADGSGTIQQTAYWRDMPMPGADGKPAKKAEPDPNEIKAGAAEAAKTLGDGVTVTSAKPVKHADGRQGIDSVFAFTDVTKLHLGMMPQVGPMKSTTTDANEAIKFAFTKGPAPKLTILMPPMKKANPDTDTQTPDPNDPKAAMAQAMMLQMFKGLVLDMSVKVNGTITKTDATYVNDKKDTVLLMHEDLDGVSKNPALMKEMNTLTRLDPKEAMKKVNESDLKKYIQVETQEKVNVEFK